MCVLCTHTCTHETHSIHHTNTHHGTDTHACAHLNGCIPLEYMHTNVCQAQMELHEMSNATAAASSGTLFLLHSARAYKHACALPHMCVRACMHAPLARTYAAPGTSAHTARPESAQDLSELVGCTCMHVCIHACLCACLLLYLCCSVHTSVRPFRPVPSCSVLFRSVLSSFLSLSWNTLGSSSTGPRPVAPLFGFLGTG